MAAEFFLDGLVRMYGRHVVYTDEGVWYPDVCNSLGAEHRMHSYYAKSLIESVNQSISEGHDGRFRRSHPCRRQGYRLSHVRRWLNLFCSMYNKGRKKIRFNRLVNLMDVRP
jgi:transposase-like protein